MTSLLTGIIVAAMLSATSLLVVLFRVSPLTAPAQAVPAFFLSVFLTVASVATLLLYPLWKWFPVHAWDEGKILSIALRQGIFLGLGTVVLLVFHLLGVLTWWIGILIYVVFVFIELAVQH